MPVVDTPVHPMTVGGKLYGCNNRKPYSEHYFAPNREYLPDGRWFDGLNKIEHAMSRECRFDMSLSDVKCAGCLHRGHGEEYDQRVRRDGK